METPDYSLMVKQQAESLFNQLEQRFSQEEVAKMRAAFEFAAEAHKLQKRKGGAPYIIHPLAVGAIVANDLGGDANMIMAAFLHDVVEDTGHTLAEIEERYGQDVAYLVDVVTKRKKDKYRQSKQIDNYRQILESVKFDTRALLIKLADRLNNMRTLAAMRPDKQMKIAGETDYFYAPLANRLGLYKIKTELENLSFKFRCPREYDTICRQLEQRKRDDGKVLKDFLQRLNKALADAGLEARTEVVYREPYSIRRKMESQQCDFAHISDLHYVRIIFPDQKEITDKSMALRIYSAVTDCFRERPGSVSNYIDNPKENGYQSFHVKVLDKKGQWEELHIGSESMIRNSTGGTMAGYYKDNVALWIEKFNTVLRDIAHHSREIEFMDGVTSSFYNDDIMVFTPAGRGVILPKNATVLDFAYEVHSHIGHHAKAGRINGRLSSVKEVLKRGDCVEIITDPKIHPNADWLEHVSTYKAKRHIRTYLNHTPSLPYQLCRECNPCPGDEVIGFKDADGKICLHKRGCKTAIRMASQQGDSIVDVVFDENPAFLYPVKVAIRGIDRKRLLHDIVETITEQQHLDMQQLATKTDDNIVECTVDFTVHSVRELDAVMDSLRQVEGVDSVIRVNRQ